LLEVIAALCASGGFAGRLHSRKQKGDQNRHDRDYDQKLDQGESREAPGLGAIGIAVHAVAPAE
jgi:hypothetical protein